MAGNVNVVPMRTKWKMPLVFFQGIRKVFKMDALGREILQIAVPAALALAADPVASLIDTAFIGHLGVVEIAAVGVSIAVFNQASRITIYPLVSITTSFVAEEDTVEKMKNAEAETINNKNEKYDPSAAKHISGVTKEYMQSSTGNAIIMITKQKQQQLDNNNNNGVVSVVDAKTKECVVLPAAAAIDDDHQLVSVDSPKKERRNIPSASTAIVLGTVLGLIQTLVLILAAKPLLGIMGVKSDSPMLPYALRYLTLRSLGAPAVLLSLALQGVFRGFKDTKTPLYATVAGDLANIILDPIFIFVCRLGVSGAAIAHVLSQYLMFVILLWRLMKEVNLLPPSFKDLQFRRFLANGFLLLTRVISATFCVTLAASLAARLGATPMAAFQICLQVWLTSSLLADGLAVAAQAILACAFAEKDYDKATATATRVLQMGFVLGIGLSLVVGAGLHFGASVFTKDVNVLHVIAIGVPFVAGTQPINSIAFVFDGVNYGASDFKYAAYSMVLVAIGSIVSLFLLSKSNGFIGIWLALTIYMALRTFAGIWRISMAFHAGWELEPDPGAFSEPPPPFLP